MILVTSKSQKLARAVSDMIYHMGILSHAELPESVAAETDMRYRAILVIFPEEIQELKEYIRRLRSYTTSPIFALTREYTDTSLFDGIYDFGISSSQLVKRITEKQRAMGAPLIAAYRLAGIDAAADLDTVRYYNSDILFTKTEKMILRYLIRAYPEAASPDSILKYAYRPGRMPLSTSVRTHISKINAKFRDAVGVSPIENPNLSGYVIKTPMLVEEFASINS